MASTIKPVQGGDINDAFLIVDNFDTPYFIKVNDADRFPHLFEKEAKGLIALRSAGIIAVPDVLSTGVVGTRQYLLLNWIERGTPKIDFWEQFGKGLALMHQKTQPCFGFEENNFIGSLVQLNTKYDTWYDFYSQCRILPLMRQLKDKTILTNSDLLKAENFCKKLPEIFPNEPPSLLHGDLWSGNFMIGADGHAVIYDPATYYGHREMDLGMSKLFGGFDPPFYEGYEEIYPLEKRWRDRLPYTQLYPLLVHASLFGGHYIGSVRLILKIF